MKLSPPDAHVPEPAFELVMPAFNEAASLAALLARAVAAAKQAGLHAGQARLVVVNNGSSDGTQEVLDKLAEGPHAAFLRVINLPLNRGYGHGLWAGLSSSRAPYVGWTHADEQCDPADAFAAFARAERAQGTALIKGRRHGRSRQEQFVTRTFEAVANVALNLQMAELNAQPKVLPRSLLRHFTRPPKDFGFDLYALYQARKHGLHIESIDVAFPPRVHGTSRWASSTLLRWRTIARMLGHIAELQWREGRLGGLPAKTSALGPTSAARPTSPMPTTSPSKPGPPSRPR